MKVLHVIPSMDPVSGGPPSVAAGLAAAQAALGCQTQIVAYRRPAADERIAASLKPIPNIDRVKMEYLSPFTKPERYLARHARRLMQPMIEQFDLVHLHGVWDPLIYTVGKLAMKHGRPFVLTPHGMLDSWALAQKPVRKRVALMLGYRRMLNGAKFLHFLTEAEKKRTAGLGLKPPGQVIPNGVFLEQLEPLPERGTFRAAHPEFGQGKLILFLGRLHYKKGLDILAAAFPIIGREFPDARLVIAGPDYGAKEGFEWEIARSGLSPRVHMLGPIYDGEKLAALRDCDCFCLPSRQEGFSMAIIEAMACGLPVVITPGCHFPEADEAHAGVIVELEASAIAEGILGILRNPEGAAKMGARGRELVVGRYTWPQVAKEMVEGYRSVVEE